MPALFLPLAVTPSHAQTHIEARLGFVASGTVLNDQLATPLLRSRFGDVAESVKARFAPAPVAGLGLLIGLRPGTYATAAATWSATQLRAEDDNGERDIQSVSVVELQLGLRRRIGPVDAGGAFGAAKFMGDDRAVMAGGAPIAPLVRLDLGSGVDAGAHRLGARAFLQMNRFGTNAITNSGGRSGNVMRYGAEAAFTWKGSDR